MENACAVVVQNETISLTDFHTLNACILQERDDISANWSWFVIPFPQFSAQYSRVIGRRDGREHVFLTVMPGHFCEQKWANQ